MALQPIKDLSILFPNWAPKSEKPFGTEAVGNTDLTGKLDLNAVIISNENSPFTKEEQVNTKLDALTGPAKPKSISLFD